MEMNDKPNKMSELFFLLLKTQLNINIKNDLNEIFRDIIFRL